ncbi:MAG: hypothetical protein LCH96_18005 [Actinobacteria bacterium]|nr:hypothetical protein [Actinomycetota bacterium]
MTELEDRLSADLLRATEVIDGSMDPDAILLTGRRQARRRLVGGAVAAVAAVLVVGLVISLGVRPSVPSMPAPAGTESAVPTPTALPRTVSFPLSQPNGRVDVAVSEDARSIEVTLTKGTRVELDEKASLSGGEVWRKRVDPLTEVVALPVKATWVAAILTDGTGSLVLGTRYVWGNRTVFVFEAASVADLDRVADYVWRDEDGSVQATALEVGTTQAIPGITERSVAVSEVGKSLIYTDDAGSFSVLPLGSDTRRAVFGRADSIDSAGSKVAAVFGMLPKGVISFTVQLAGTQAQWGKSCLSTSFDTTTVRCLVVAVGPAPATGGHLVDSITYTTPSGKDVTITPEG